MPPSVSRIGRINGKLFGYLFQWNEAKKLGELFDSSSGFTLPNSAIKSPDVSWIKKVRWQNLKTEDQNRFAPIVPDFVAEILSKWDDEQEGEAKMKEYIGNGVQLGWLINADDYRVQIFRDNGEKEVLEGQKITLDGEEVLKGFQLKFNTLFES
jgi:Uma2 family endonuclease